ncbi:hypothetical protein BU24DRAFT_419197 [Aaosphaeria arxii CBS 175.79]|uniref:Uncharacterized protein n=1 Tax=Aaosphaeria arxii CBS 175.79 TaxID=1450172 RepID=A0A6A5Y1Z6_9PLEO|nr:uncharacterized protein BU24DRAFT_419197 [Aaosphaeria arxii CBS 175.79]KAF2019595.1 hypothetical protein BU24DRAFT_419197 [Aaosphaeria arxii CBS 175.79]
MNFSFLRPSFRSLRPTTNFASQKAILQNPTTTSLLQRTTSPFSTTAKLEKRNKGKVRTDARITAIRYHLSHPLTPRPLHFSRTRYLRHWTIHRAWLLFLRKRRWAEERELERQYESMRAACEHLRLLDDNGLRVASSEGGGQGADAGTLGPRGKEVGRLYRGAMNKKGVWGSVPVEYARIQVDYPPRDGWNHEWTR